MNLGLIEAELYDQFGFRAAPQADVTTRFRRMINETQRQIIGSKGMARLRRKVLPFSSIKDYEMTVLPQAATNVYTITDRVNQWVLDSVSMEDIRARNPGLVYTTSYPADYAIMDYAAPVVRDPSDASELFFKSDAAGDDATKKVCVEGITTGGYYRSVTVAMNGVTAVSLGATITNWITITKFYIKNASGVAVPTAAGNITLLEDSGSGTELSRIPVGRTMARYTRIHWGMVPNQVNTYYADCDIAILDMVSEADEPYLPEEYHWLLKTGAALKECKRRKDWVGHGVEKAELKDGIDRLRVYIRRMGGVASNRSPRERFSQLGPWFPSGS